MNIYPEYEFILSHFPTVAGVYGVVCLELEFGHLTQINFQGSVNLMEGTSHWLSNLHVCESTSATRRQCIRFPQQGQSEMQFSLPNLGGFQRDREQSIWKLGYLAFPNNSNWSVILKYLIEEVEFI